MKTVDVTITSAVDGTTTPARLMVCMDCGCDHFHIFILATGHQHLQCMHCAVSYCDGSCGTPQREASMLPARSRMSADARTRPWLDDAELADLCAPLRSSAAQVKHLRNLGLRVQLRPNGRPLVMRAELERVLVGPAALIVGGQYAHNAPVPAPTEPDRTALLHLVGSRRRAPAGS